MAVKIPSGNETYEIMGSGKTYILAANKLLDVTGGYGIHAGPLAHDDKIEIKGQIAQDGMGGAVVTEGDDMFVHIAKGGNVTGDGGITMAGANARFTNDGTLRTNEGSAVYTAGANAEIVNHGKIFGPEDFYGVEMHGSSSELTNTGRIEADYAVVFNDTKATINLGEKSVVIGNGAAIYSETAEPSMSTRITNNGRITGDQYAIQTQDGKETVINHGTIEGMIYLGSGKDVFDNRGGKVDHKIEGGAGDDTLITDKASVKLRENGGSEGFDTVKSTVTYTLSENVEKLILLGSGNTNGFGTEDGNTLVGNAGNNKLAGVDGSGSDTFVFMTGGGRDTLMDYDAGIDKIDLRNLNGINNFNDLKNNHMSESGNDVIISSGGDQLVIRNADKGDFDTNDFMI